MNNSMIENLEHEIQQFLKRYGKTITDRHIIAWDGYLTGLYMHDVINLSEYTYLSGILPKVDNNPVIDIFLGVDDE